MGNDEDFTFNELSVQEIKNTHMDEEFAKDKREPTVMDAYGSYNKKDTKPLSISSRLLTIRQPGRRCKIAMKAKNDD